ncbi:beta-N-acetylhexosaminidase, partial [Vibrio sp.]|nr:beta-N-acetylhexosaminidase [Vibrio sp.]
MSNIVLFPSPRSLSISSQSNIDINKTGLNLLILEGVVNIFRSNTVMPQGFDLTINENDIVIKTRDKAGEYYALSSLKQIIAQSNQYLPKLSMSDYPDFEKRGIILDVSRDKIPTMDTLYSLIDFWSELRFNQLQLYTEHTFAYKDHQTVWEDYSPFTA